jgi:cell division protein ZapA
MSMNHRQKIEQLVEVEIYGQKYKLKADNDESYIREIASYVDKKMRHIGKRASTGQLSKLAILTAINITHEYLQSKKESRQRELSIERKTKDLIDSIEEEFEDMKF